MDTVLLDLASCAVTGEAIDTKEFYIRLEDAEQIVKELLTNNPTE